MKFHATVCLTFLLIFSAVSLSFQNMPKAHCSLQVENNKIKVDVYFVALDGVGASGISNVSRVLDGVNKAVKDVNDSKYVVETLADDSYQNISSYIHYSWGWDWIKTEFPTNATLHVVNDWHEYKSIVESGHECIIINGHGEIVPVPVGYSKESWTDKIAEAMLSRNVTWVHINGYPFSYAWSQESNSSEYWGEKGFQQLMQHIGKGNATIAHDTGTYYGWLTGGAEANLRKTWGGIYVAKQASTDHPMLAHDFSDYIALKIWGEGGDNEYLSGAVLAFKSQVNTTSHGFYVYIGANQMRGPDGDLADHDYYVGYMGCAGGLWSLVSRTARETLLSEAENLIQTASQEGRTEGLQQARSLLANAKYCDSLYGDDAFLQNVYSSMVAAVEAAKPKDDPIFMWLAGLGLSLTFVGVGAVIWHKRKNQDEEEI